MRRKQESEERNAGNTKKVYLGYRINPKLLFCVSLFFFSRKFILHENEKRRTKMNNTLGGGTGGGREQQQHARNQQATKVGSGDNGVPHTKFSSKQSKTSTVTITGTC